MTDRENLPTVINQQIAVHTGKRGSLVMRGLIAVQASKGQALMKADDALYRVARDAYNRINDPSNKHSAHELWSAGDAELKKVFEAFQQLADRQYGKAYHPLSILYLSRNDIENGRSFTQLAIEWCLANQASQGMELWSDLGEMYRDGHGVAKDDAQAAIWYRKAAEQGDVIAQYNLGYMYYKGQGVSQDIVQAVYWYRKAAVQGIDYAQQFLESRGIDWRKQDAS